MCDGLALSASYGESDKYYYGGYGPETINLSEIDTSGSSSRADLFVVDNNGIYKSSGLNT